MDSVVQKV